MPNDVFGVVCSNDYLREVILPTTAVRSLSHWNVLVRDEHWASLPTAFRRTRMPNQKKPARTGLFLAAYMLLAGSSAYGQAVYGSLYGTVKDTSGAVIKGATVTGTGGTKGGGQTHP